MCKDKDKLKTKSKKRRKTDNSNATTSRQNLKLPKTRCIIDDGIGVSRQLAQKMKTNRSSGKPRKHVNNSNNNEPRICGNGKPMPSLADLEKMFEDSDDDVEESKVNNTTNTTLNVNPVNCSTPKKTPIISEEKLKSPSTIKTIADKMLDFISNLCDEPPPPVVPPKKRKKTEVPYIVGCKDRAKVLSKPTVNFCKGYDDYGVDPNNSDEDDCPKKRAKKSKIPNVSKSIFNAKSDEIAAHLNECDAAFSDGSSDSNKTVAYEYYNPNNSKIPRSFSPLPSTSRDSETIHKNDIRFNESLIVEQLNSRDTENDLEIINEPLDTIVVDNEIEPIKVQPKSEPLIVIDDLSPPHIPDNKLSENIHFSVDDDSCIEIIENKPSKIIEDYPIPVDDYYSTLDFNQPCNDDITEIIDVDDVIAESNAIIEKYRKASDINTVTLVEPQANSTVTPFDSSLVADDSMEPVNVANTPQDTLTNNIMRQNSVEENYPPKRLRAARPPTETNLRQNSSDVEFVSSTPRQNSFAVVPTMLRLNNLPVCDVPQSSAPNEDNVENVVRNFFNQTNSNGSQSNSQQSSSCNAHNQTINSSGSQSNSQQSSSCNAHNHQTNTMGILSFLQSISDIANNINNNTIRSNTQSQEVSAPPASQTRNESQQSSKGLGDCPICMDSLATTQVASTICGHIFCMKCISAAVKSSGKKCPTCRKPLKGVGFHPLFL